MNSGYAGPHPQADSAPSQAKSASPPQTGCTSSQAGSTSSQASSNRSPKQAPPGLLVILPHSEGKIHWKTPSLSWSLTYPANLLPRLKGPCCLRDPILWYPQGIHPI